MYLCVEEYANDSVVRFSEEEKKQIQDLIIPQETKYGFDNSKMTWINRYDFDDYLYIANIVREAQGMYYRNHLNPLTGDLIEGYYHMPYIHVEFFEEAVSADKYLNAGISGPDENGCYTLRINRYLLFRYIHFLQDVFDKNMEEVIESDDLKSALKRQPLVSQQQLQRICESFREQGELQCAEAYAAFAEMLPNGVQIHMPIPKYLRSPEISNNTFDGLLYYDKERDILVSPIKKKIYTSSGFSKFYFSRKELITEIFDKSIKMLVMHEFAHVANGHCLLSKNNTGYANQKRIRVCLEQNADETAIRWLIDNVLFETADSNPESAKLKYTKDELFYELSMTVFSGYLLLSWGYRDDERIWDNATLQNYVEDESIQHPIYQFRTFHIINRALNFIYDIFINQSGYPHTIITYDDKPLCVDMFMELIDEIMDLLNSFESTITITLSETIDLENMKANSWKLDKQSIPNTVQEVPYLMPVFFMDAKKEKELIDATWPEVRLQLISSGAYSKLI